MRLKVAGVKGNRTRAKPALSVLTVAATVLFAGCANLNSVYRDFSIDKGQSVSIDVKQRVVLSSRKQDGTHQYTIACAEPSPDALSAFANSASVSGQSGDAQVVQAAISASESAAFVGLRTQTIQLLRDGMYRICEGYLGGAINEVEFSSLQRRYQNLMMGLLAIEQLTGAVTPRPVALTTAAASGTGGDTQKEQDALTEAQKVKIDADINLTSAQKAVDDQSTVVATEKKNVDATKAKNKKNPKEASDDDVTAAVSEANEAAKKKDGLDLALGRQRSLDQLAVSNVQEKRAALDAAKLRVSAAANGAYSGGTDGKMDPATSKEIATTVEQIVRDVVSNSFIQDACLSFLRTNEATSTQAESFSRKFSADQENTMKDACIKVITASAALFQANVDSTLTRKN